MKKEIGLNPTAQDEQDNEKYKEQMKKHKLSRQPAIIQTVMVSLIAFMIFLFNYTILTNTLGQMTRDVLGLNLQTLLLISIGLNLFFGMYAFLMNYWSAFIIHKIIYAKLFNKRIMICRGEDKIFRMLVVDKTNKTYRVEGIGEWKINKNAMGWLENGLIMAICKEGFAEMIDLDDIEAKFALTVDEGVFEDRIRNVKLEAALENQKPINIRDMMFLIPLVLVVGVAAYLIISQLQQGSCQGELVKLAQTCGEVAKGANIPAETVVDKMPIINQIT